MFADKFVVCFINTEESQATYYRILSNLFAKDNQNDDDDLFNS